MPRVYELADVFKAAADALRAGLHVCLPGRVESYDPKTQTIDVTPTVKNPIADPDTGDQDHEAFPTIPNVPVNFPRGGGYHCSFPLEKGDHVTLIFSELATGQWRETGDTSEPIDMRRQSLAYPFAIPGAFPDKDALIDPINPLFDGAMILGKDGDPTGSIRLRSGSVECGGAIPVPVALAAPAVTGMQAIKTAMQAMTNALKALQAAATAAAGVAVPNDGGHAAFVAFATSLGTMNGALDTAMTAVGTAMTAAAQQVPATITKGQ